MPSALQLPGSLSVIQTPLINVGDSLDTFVEMLVVEEVRVAATDSGTFTYYIDVPVDLNALITYTPSASGDNVDDAYAFAGFSVTDDESANILLPEASAVNVPAGLIDANNVPKGILAGTFPVNLTIAVSNAGMMTGSITISGANVTSDVVDSSLKAQVAYWQVAGVVVTNPTPTSSDVLEATLAASQLNGHFASELATILDYYNNVQLLDTWTVSISEIESSTNNSLAQHARQIGDTGTSTIFAAGDQVMAMTPFSYSVAIVDYLGTSTTVIAPSNVYGVATQVAF
jgi:hypothetical protein